ncbi:hypothetical protein B9Z55_006161 [Caenorhabditis nigoni]|uniref:Uncharacterized protein n=1 Tax=Caenorhabditis nigoni TaxID=1611254 RepID=A0A2G5V3X5_9PELO|nr:hypothetical protein B9Z55_006161 [Caenorhabditis nigoni]
MEYFWTGNWRFITDNARHRVLLPSGILWNFGCMRVTMTSWRFITDGSRHRVLLPSGILWNFGCLRVTMTRLQ